MKRFFAFVLVGLCLALMPMVGHARQWTGTQLVFTVEGTKPITANTAWSGDLCYFNIPMSASTIWFAYTGPTFQATPWLWVSPQLGYGGGWKTGQDTFVNAGWATVTLPSTIGKIDLDGEVLNTGSVHDVYWYNQANHAWGAVNAGFHWESTNAKHQWGPHFGLKQGPWKGELRYFTGAGSHTIRLAVKLGF